MKVKIILGDRGYDARECFDEIAKHKSLAGIKVKKNACAGARGSPEIREVVLTQKKNYNEWKERVHYTMRCVVESIFSGAKEKIWGIFLEY